MDNNQYTFINTYILRNILNFPQYVKENVKLYFLLIPFKKHTEKGKKKLRTQNVSVKANIRTLNLRYNLLEAFLV